MNIFKLLVFCFVAYLIYSIVGCSIEQPTGIEVETTSGSMNSDSIQFEEEKDSLNNIIDSLKITIDSLNEDKLK